MHITINRIMSSGIEEILEEVREYYSTTRCEASEYMQVVDLLRENDYPCFLSVERDKWTVVLLEPFDLKNSRVFRQQVLEIEVVLEQIWQLDFNILTLDNINIDMIGSTGYKYRDRIY